MNIKKYVPKQPESASWQSIAKQVAADYSHHRPQASVAKAKIRIQQAVDGGRIIQTGTGNGASYAYKNPAAVTPSPE